MSKQFSEAERCVQVAKGLRELADRFEACEFVPSEAEKVLALGVFPDVSLKRAREKRDAARRASS